MASEQRGFVFAVTFIIMFATLLATIPVDLQGQGNSGSAVMPIDPNLLSDFTDTANFSTPAFVPWLTLLVYTYDDFGGKDWICGTDEIQFDLNAKILAGGVIWLGQLEPMRFISPTGIDSSLSITFDEIDADAEEGTVRYNLISTVTGRSAGGFLVYWNTTTYTDSFDAWDNDNLYFLHGIGIGETATANIGSLIISLLLLQLPDVPLLVNLLIATPIWACIIFVLWFIIKEMIPFV